MSGARIPVSAAQAAELRRLLHRLAQGASIGKTEDGGFRLNDESSPGEGGGKAVARRAIEACLAADLIQWQEERLVLSDAGRSHLRRSLSGDDPFREQHQLRSRAMREIGGARRPVTVNEAESPLGWLKSRKDRNGRPLISEAQYEAGERLRADYWFAHLSPRVTSNWAAPAASERSRRGAPSNAAALRDEVLAAKERVMRALMAVGPELSGILVGICCELKGLEEAEKANGWPQRAGKVVLQIALTRLAKHFGLIAGDGPGTARRRMRHWGEADYRPSLDAWGEE
ncbi:MAG: DUF6456 domain-containing protein [Methyloceanibacter sp.]|uniref:DUF6456 domain-containing protein n=1 Tax=Methyloceanibacter sp. TaxID=1965321 RepID=UPI003D6CF98A